MLPTARALLMSVVLVAVSTLAACRSSHFDPPELQGDPAMVDAGGTPRLWVLTKQEEQRQVGTGRRTAAWRTDTFFHFDLKAFDPATAKPAWEKRLLTIGDPEAQGSKPSRVLGSAVEARLLGQDGELVWLLIGDVPYAVNAADGNVVVDAASLQERVPVLKGLLPSEARHYAFDRGLVVMAADARRFVVRGPQLEASRYAPPPPATEPFGRKSANGQYRNVPMRPLMGEAPVRHVTLGGQRLGLYSDKEAADAIEDTWGDKLAYPYSIDDEGKLARRTFRRTTIATTQQFDDRFERISAMTAIDGAPTFLKGRFVAAPGTEEAMRLTDPEGVLVWHSTRMDSAGQLALARLDADLRTTWTATLPLSEADIINRVTTWHLPGRLVATGDLNTQVDGISRREPHLVSIDLASGNVQAWNLEREAAVP